MLLFVLVNQTPVVWDVGQGKEEIWALVAVFLPRIIPCSRLPLAGIYWLIRDNVLLEYLMQVKLV